MYEYLEALWWVVLTVCAAICLMFLGAKIEEKNIANKLCSQSNYDFCVKKDQYEIKYFNMED